MENENTNLIFVAPKNFKSGNLILGIFTIKDVIVISIFTLLTFFLFIFYVVTASKVNLVVISLFFIPILIMSSLYIPLKNFHTTAIFLKLFFIFLKRKKKYIYGGVRYDVFIKE